MQAWDYITSNKEGGKLSGAITCGGKKHPTSWLNHPIISTY